MILRRILFSFLIVSMLVAGCSEPDESNVGDTSATEIPVIKNQSSETLPPTIIPSDPLPTPLPNILPTLTPVASPTTAPIPTKVSLCEADKWEIVPIGLYEYPQGEGWKIVVIQVAVYNGSSYWGSLSVDKNALDQDLILITEDSFSYYRDRTTSNVYNLGNAHTGLPPADSPYEGRPVHVPSQLLSKILPPGFTYKGDYDVNLSGYYTLGGKPDSWQQLVFRVPETQKDFLVFFPSAKIECFGEDGQFISEIKPTIEWHLPNDIRSINFPTDRPNSDFPDFVGFSVTKGEAIFTFAQASKADVELDLFFSLENTNKGYDVEETLTVYAIGNDGIHRTPGCGFNSGCAGFEGRGDARTFWAGPGQIKESAIAFIVDPNVIALQ